MVTNVPFGSVSLLEYERKGGQLVTECTTGSVKHFTRRRKEGRPDRDNMHFWVRDVLRVRVKLATECAKLCGGAESKPKR